MQSTSLHLQELAVEKNIRIVQKYLVFIAKMTNTRFLFLLGSFSIGPRL